MAKAVQSIIGKIKMSGVNTALGFLIFVPFTFLGILVTIIGSLSLKYP